MEDDLDEISMNIKIRISWFPVSLMTKTSNSFLCLNHALMQTLVSKTVDFSLHSTIVHKEILFDYDLSKVSTTVLLVALFYILII